MLLNSICGYTGFPNRCTETSYKTHRKPPRRTNGLNDAEDGSHETTAKKAGFEEITFMLSYTDLIAGPRSRFVFGCILKTLLLATTGKIKKNEILGFRRWFTVTS